LYNKIKRGAKIDLKWYFLFGTPGIWNQDDTKEKDEIGRQIQCLQVDFKEGEKPIISSPQ
jgi:hypothetical protein